MAERLWPGSAHGEDEAAAEAAVCAGCEAVHGGAHGGVWGEPLPRVRVRAEAELQVEGARGDGARRGGGGGFRQLVGALQELGAPGARGGEALLRSAWRGACSARSV